MLVLVPAGPSCDAIAAKLTIARVLLGSENLHLCQVRFEVSTSHLGLQRANLSQRFGQTLGGDFLGGEEAVELPLLFDKCATLRRCSCRHGGEKSFGAR